MKKCCFIIPYFGKFPDYFELFLKSCEANEDFNWLVITDDRTKYNFPSNVQVLYRNLDWLIKLMKYKFDFAPAINNIHKICDFKPSYGFLFEEFLTDYRFWGYCDIDVIFGNLSHFITEDLLQKFDKIGTLGHFTLFKNDYYNNRVFMKKIDGESWYKESFTNPKTTIFDETFGGEKNINTIFKKTGHNVFEDDLSFNCQIAPANLIRTYYDKNQNIFINEKYRRNVCLWQNGTLNCFFKINNQLMQKEYMYMHFQQRKMRYSSNVLSSNNFQVRGNGFYVFDDQAITNQNFNYYSKPVISLRYLKINVKWKINGAYKRIIMRSK